MFSRLRETAQYLPAWEPHNHLPHLHTSLLPSPASDTIWSLSPYHLASYAHISLPTSSTLSAPPLSPPHHQISHSMLLLSSTPAHSFAPLYPTSSLTHYHRHPLLVLISALSDVDQNSSSLFQVLTKVITCWYVYDANNGTIPFLICCDVAECRWVYGDGRSCISS